MLAAVVLFVWPLSWWLASITYRCAKCLIIIIIMKAFSFACLMNLLDELCNENLLICLFDVVARGSLIVFIKCYFVWFRCQHGLHSYSSAAQLR